VRGWREESGTLAVPDTKKGDGARRRKITTCSHRQLERLKTFDHVKTASGVKASQGDYADLSSLELPGRASPLKRENLALL
jgi:hypothetical protein